MNEFGCGFKLASLALGEYENRDEFWKTLNWWWQETHVDIPQYLKSKKLQSQLDVLFGDTSNGEFDIHRARTLLATQAEYTFSQTGNYLVINSRVENKGYLVWKSAKIKIGMTSELNHFRKLMFRILLGAEWESLKPPPIPTLYTLRLREKVS